jgi:hypothetical protein
MVHVVEQNEALSSNPVLQEITKWEVRFMALLCFCIGLFYFSCLRIILQNDSLPLFAL